jgi:DNA-nicking Smr family endonuclease
MFSRLKHLLKNRKSDSEKPDVPDRAVLEPPSTPSRAASPSQPPDKTSPPATPPRFNRQGLPVFRSDQDVAALFEADDDTVQPDAAKKSSRIPVEPAVRKKKSSSQKMRVTRLGFPVLDDADLNALMLQRAEAHPSAADDPSPSSGAVKPANASARRDRHGIPILKSGERLFSDAAEAEESFEELLKASLGNKSVEVLLREKKDAIRPPRPISLKKKLKAYPLPQSQLDLHGYTSLKAGLRTESYLKSAYHSNTHTVIIIVGKGLHSEEGAVLPDVVEQKLLELKKAKMILTYEWDNKKKSKSGAVTVYLDNLRFGC